MTDNPQPGLSPCPFCGSAPTPAAPTTTVAQEDEVRACKAVNRTTIRIEVLRALFEYATQDKQFPIDEPFNSYLRETMVALSPPAATLECQAMREALAASEQRVGQLLKAMNDHNNDCQQRCGVDDQEAVACQYRPYFENTGRRCSTCPTYEKIYIPVAAIDAARGKI